MVPSFGTGIDFVGNFLRVGLGVLEKIMQFGDIGILVSLPSGLWTVLKIKILSTIYGNVNDFHGFEIIISSQK